MAAGKKFSVWYWVMTVAVTVALLAPATLVANGLFVEDDDFSQYNTFQECFGTDQSDW